MKKKIYVTLNELGVPFGLKGRDYIETAVELILNEGRMDITKELYPRIAKEFETKALRVERAIRHAIEECFSNADPKILKEFFGNTISFQSGKVTNLNFLHGIVKRIQILG